MKLFRTKTWSPMDIILLKWCCVFFGVIFGSYLSVVVKKHVWLFLVAAIIFAVKPSINYFSGEDVQQPS